MSTDIFQHPRFQFKDIQTGQPPTLEDWEDMKERARHILDNWKYQAPEKIDWAMKVDPEHAEKVICWAPGDKSNVSIPWNGE